MIDDYAIPLLSPLWWLGIVATLAGVAAVLLGGRRLRPAGARRAARTLALLYLTKLAVYQVDAAARGEWLVGESLPLHLCGLAGLIGAWLMFQPRQGGYELVYYWGTIGAIQALATPLLPAGNGLLRIADHYLGHGLILLFALWPAVIWGMRPRPRSVVAVFLVSQLLLPTVGGVNWLLGSNYMYLASRPEVSNPFVIGEWPWYILGFEVALLLHLVALYVPFAFLAQRRPPGRGGGAERALG